MAEDVANLTFEYLLRIDAKLARVLDESFNPKVRVTAVEERLAQVDLSVPGVNCRIDRVEACIERRRDLIELPH